MSSSSSILRPSAVYLAVAWAALCIADALPVDPNVTEGLRLPKNISFVGETVISVPVGILPQRDQALARLEGKNPSTGAIQAALESRGDILTPLGDFLQRILDSIMGRDQPAPAL